MYINRKKILKKTVNWSPFIFILKKEWKQAGENSEENIITRDRIWKGIYKNLYKEHTQKSRYYLFKLSAIAAASIIVCFLAGRTLFSDQTEEIQQPVSLLISAVKSQIYILPDGTKVWMEDNSELRFSSDFMENRELWLRGNSTFEVVKKKENSFKVHLDNSYVEVKGTSFYINQDIPEANIVALYSGSIDFVLDKNKQVIELQPFQRIIYNSVEASTKVEHIYENIHWENGNYKLSNTNLTDLTKFLEWKYNIHIELKNLPRRELKITGNIHYNETIESVLNKVTFSLKLKHNRMDKKYIIHR